MSDYITKQKDKVQRTITTVQSKNRKNAGASNQAIMQMVKVYVIEDLSLFRNPKTTFLSAAAERVNHKQHGYVPVTKNVDEFHKTVTERLGGLFQRGNPSKGPDIGNINETIVFKSHGGAGGLFSEPIFGGYSPKKFASILIDGNYLPDNYAGRITLSGCNTAVEYKGLFGSGFLSKKSFASLFVEELKNYAQQKNKTLGNFEVKGTLGTARTGSGADEGKLFVDKVGFDGNWSSIPAPKKHTYSDGTEVASGKDVKKRFKADGTIS